MKISQSVSIVFPTIFEKKNYFRLKQKICQGELLTEKINIKL